MIVYASPTGAICVNVPCPDGCNDRLFLQPSKARTLSSTEVTVTTAKCTKCGKHFKITSVATVLGESIARVSVMAEPMVPPVGQTKGSGAGERST